MNELNATTIGLFLLVVFPGLISITIYRLIMPARAPDWGSAILQGVFYSAVNLVLAIPLLYVLVAGYDPLSHPVRFSIAAILVLVVTPIAWPLVLVAIFKSKHLSRRIRIPYPTAWDFFFAQRGHSFVLVHLSDGTLLGAYWGANSFAGSYPNDGEIYLEAVCAVDAAGNLRDPIPNSRGILLRKEQYSYIEFFAATTEENQDGQERQQRQRTEEV